MQIQRLTNSQDNVGAAYMALQYPIHDDGHGHAAYACSTHLVAKDSHAGGRGHLVRTEPYRSQARGKRQDAHLGQGNDRLANEADVEERRVHREDLDPGTHTSADDSN